MQNTENIETVRERERERELYSNEIRKIVKGENTFIHNGKRQTIKIKTLPQIGKF